MPFFEFMFFPLWIIIFVFLFVVLLFIFWIWAIIDCLVSRLRPSHKLVWLIIILFFHFIGALLYFILAKSMEEKMAKSKKFGGKRLLRSKGNRMVGGVCGGIGEYVSIDPTIIRLLWVLFIFFSFGAGVLAYVIAWVIIPEK